MTDLDIETRQPRYATLAATLAREIRQGSYAVGDLLPTEAQLCERFQVSRSTVREALRRLSELGLISKAQGVGTRVEAVEPRANYNISVRSVAELMQYGSETRFVQIDRQRVALAPEEASALGVATFRGAKVTGYRVAANGDSRPISFAEIYVAEPYLAVLEHRRPTEPFYRAIERRFEQQIVGIDQEIRAVAVRPRAATALDVPAGSPGLYILRRFYGRGRALLEITVNVHPAERFSHRMFLNRQLGPHADSSQETSE